MKNILVIGATGDVGQGICVALMSSGYRVIASSRSPENLEALKQRVAAHGAMDLAPGSVATEPDAKVLRDRVKGMAAELHGVIITVNVKSAKMALIERQPENLISHLSANLIPHFIAAKVFIPSLENNGMYLSIGGGMADFIVPGNGLTTIAQAAQRNMIRMIAREARGGPVLIRELLLYSHITGESNRADADPGWFTDEECGRHVLAILRDPELFPGPILALKSKEQTGRPEAPPAGKPAAKQQP